jgi:PAS domain S-box-containing protein
LKGLLFVIVTAALLYVLVRRQLALAAKLSHTANAESIEKQRTQKLLSEILDSSPDAIFAKDLEGRYILFNREVARVTDKDPAQVLGSDDRALFPLEQAEMVRENDRQVVASNHSICYEENVDTVDGLVTYLATKGPLHDLDGRVIGVFGISRDITERIKNERALRASEATLRESQRIAGIGSYVLDIQTGLWTSSEVLDNLFGFDGTYQTSQSTYSFTRTSVIALLTASIGIGASLAWAITRSITTPVKEALALAQTVAEGDLTSLIHSDGKDEIGQLLRAMKGMTESLVVVVSNVRSGSEGVATASSEIAQGNHDLSSRTESQASALEETAASMEELSATVKQNADSARQANQLAMSASTVAMQGGQVVAQVVDTMKGISDSSKKIADIIGVIDGIAFQTNILALNAAVEAARAGEQGRGFAVVASEVRSLAGRSADAAKEIKTLIDASVERVELGTVLVDKAGTTMTDAVASIRRVADLMGEISSASNEQAAGVSQVGEAVQQMDQVTQQNAALVEQMAAAASSLSTQADELVKVVAVFKLDANSQALTRRRTTSSPRVQSATAPKSKLSIPKPKPVASRPAPPEPASLPKPVETAKADSVGSDEWETF